MNSKEYVIHVESMGINKTNVPIRTKLMKGKETGKFLAHVITAVRQDKRLQITGIMR